MMLKTFAILLSLGTTYSTATYAMDTEGFSIASQRKIRAADEELSKISQSRRAAEEETSKRLQRAPVERAAAEEALKQMKEKLDAEDRKLRDESSKLMDALMEGTIDAEEVIRRREELFKISRAAKEAAFEEFDKQFGNN